MKKDLYTETLELLRADSRTIDKIAEGAGVNKHWLSKFKQGRFENPGVRTVEKLYRYLNETRPSRRPKPLEEARA